MKQQLYFFYLLQVYYHCINERISFLSCSASQMLCQMLMEERLIEVCRERERHLTKMPAELDR